MNSTLPSREQIITSMCMTRRHDYGLQLTDEERASSAICSGMSSAERKSLFQEMAQIYDNDIAPLLQKAQCAENEGATPDLRTLCGAVIDACEEELGLDIWPKDSDALSELLDRCEEALLSRATPHTWKLRRYVIHAASQAATPLHGFWNNETGWGELGNATVFLGHDFSLKATSAADSRWVELP